MGYREPKLRIVSEDKNYNYGTSQRIRASK